MNNKNCPICSGKGEYSAVLSIGGVVTIHKCGCKNFGISPDLPPINDIQTKPVVENVGEEFMKWAELYWGLDKKIFRTTDENVSGEACPYSYMRTIFVRKINNLVENKR